MIVVDDASTDDTASLAPRAHPDVRVVRWSTTWRLLRRGERRDRGGPRATSRPAPQQRHRGHRRLGRGGPRPVRDPEGRVGRPARPRPVRPEPGRLGGRSLRCLRLAEQAGARRAFGHLGDPDLRIGSSARADRAPSIGPTPSRAVGAFDPRSGRTTRTSTWPSGSAGRVTNVPSRPIAGSSTTSPPPTTTGARRSSDGWRATPRSSSGRTCRSPGSPPPRFPHAAFTLARGFGGWRRAGIGRSSMGSSMPFASGGPSRPAGRSGRPGAIARGRPHFPLTLAPLGDARNHSGEGLGIEARDDPIGPNLSIASRLAYGESPSSCRAKADRGGPACAILSSEMPNSVG